MGRREGDERQAERFAKVEVLVLCRRVGRMKRSADHLACAYCFGKLGDVERGDRARFCDYRAGDDPICFGFPEFTSRLLD